MTLTHFVVEFQRTGRFCGTTGLRGFLILMVVSIALVMSAAAQPPDLTAGELPTSSITINLGPTGLQGWLYHNDADTSESRQILITAVDGSSPADGVLAVDDVILGADGTGANPLNFTSDARRSFAKAIQDAEANSPASLKLLRWRAGVTTIETITLQTLGAYAATAPYNCPKSAQILEDGLAHRTANENAGNMGFGALALLAGDDPSNPANPARQTLAQTEAHALIATQEQIDFWKSGQIDTGSKITWRLGHELIVLAEYYLKTSDPLVLPTIEAMAVQVANGQSHLGTMGHQLTNPDAQGALNGTYNVGYGTVNSAGMPTFLGLLLAKECGLTNPVIESAIERASRYYAAYTGYGAHPYGEHGPSSKSHEANGKSGLASLCFMLLDDRVEDGRFFSKMATAAASERENGHTGPYFNQLWAPLGAASGGEEAVSAHFSRISWMLDLNREWDGGFYWNRLDGTGSGERWNDFDMSTAALLLYALPLRELHITGRAHDPARYLTTQEVAAAVAADDYDAATRTTNELVTDLGNWSPKVQLLAAEEIGLRTAEHATLVPQLIAIANDVQAGESRVGACFAVGEVGDGSAAADLAALLDDAEGEVRYASAEALRYLPQADKLAQVDTILAAAASTGKPFFPIDPEDPLQFAHLRLSMLLFYSGNAYGPKGVIWGTGIDGIDRNLLYPAIRAVAGNPNGQARGTLQKTYTNLTYDDVLALSGTILDSVIVRAPADKMFSGGVRSGGVEAMQMHNIGDGVQACMKLITDTPSDDLLELLGTFGGGVYTVEPDPDVIGFLESYLISHPTGARLGLDGIYQDTNPTPLNALKTVQLVTVDNPTLELPANSTVLRATAMDHAKGDSVYTWNKVFGPGAVTFTPNGTAAAAHSTVQFDGTPGAYEFEVTMSDSRGLTESYGTVVVLVSDGSAADTTAPPTPGFATAPTGTSTNSVTMTAQVVTDPEGNGVKYYFTCTSGGGNDSGWQTSPIYTDTGLLPDSTYEYTVTARDLSTNLNTSAASVPLAGSTLGLPTSTLSEGVFHILGSSNSPSSNTVHKVSVNGAYAGFQGQGNVGSVSVTVDETFNGTIVDYAFIRESATPNVIETYADGGAGLITYGSWLAREGGDLGNSSDLKLWTATDPGAPGYSSSADFTSSTGVGTFDNINGSVDISGVTVGSVYFFYSGYRSTPLFSATMKDAEMIVADVPLPVFGDGDYANNSEHFVCSINFVNNDGCDTIDWSMTSSLYNGHPHCSLKGVVLVSSTGQTTIVPNVVGLAQSSAESSVRSAGFSNGTALLRSSSTVPVGSVISQSPISGTTAVEDSAVNIVVSNGPPTTVVPNVIGLDQLVAESQIVAQGLVVGTVTTESSDTVEAGGVISQSPSSGNFLVVGAAVDMVVSSGPEAATVPNVVGVDEGSAGSQIVAVGLVVGTVTTQSSATVPAGDVISQSPGGGSSATVGSAVDLVVSSGPPTISPTAFVDDQGGASVTVGDLVTYTLSFSEDMDQTTVDAADFSNAGSSTITVGTITEIAPGVFTVQVNPTDSGTLQLQISAGAALANPSGIPLDTLAAIIDDTSLTVDSAAEVTAVIYEPFDYPVGAIIGQSGSSEIGLDGTWFASSTTQVVAASLNYGSLPTSGGSIGNLSAGQNRFGGARAISASALAVNGLLDDGNSLWFSAVVGYGTGANRTNAKLSLALGNNQFSGGNNDFWIVDEGPQVGSGVGFYLGNVNGIGGSVLATQFRDLASGDGVAGNVYGTWETAGTVYGENEHGLIVGRIDWGAGSDTITLYQPDTSLNLGAAISTLTVDVDQSTFDTLTFARGDVVTMDEIRFGDSFESVIGAASAPDTTPPTLASSDIVDDLGGANVTEGNLVTHTVTFSEDIDDTTLSAADFANAGSSSITIGTITETLPGVFTVEVTPITSGTLQLQISAGAVIHDMAGNSLDTSFAITDDTTITVDASNSAPTWNSDPMVETDAAEDSSYSSTLADDATDVDVIDTLAFAKVSGPAWLSVASDGTLSGTPSNSDVGANAFTVSVTDNIAPAVNATLNITVINTNDAPVFTVNPINGPAATEDLAYSGSVAGSASDQDAGDNLTYAKANGPAWLLVAANGDFSGLPGNADVGVNVFTISVSDNNGGSDSATLNITVINTNDAPVFIADPIAGGGATEDALYAGTIAGSATDEDAEDSLSYTKVSGPAWLSVAGDGTLSGTPTNSDVGANTFTVSVSDGTATPVEATINITVINTNDAPVFTADPIAGGGATEDAPYNGTLAGSSTDDDGDTLSYAKTGGPAWLLVAGNGALSGTPTNSDVGLNVFTVSVNDGNGGSDTATLNITVINTNDAPVFINDPIEGSDATEDEVYSGTLTGTSTDDDGDSPTYAKDSGPAWLNVASDGTLSGTPTSGDVGANAFTVSVSDGNGGSDTASLNITVNAAPVSTGLVRTTVSGVTNTAWTTVDLGQTYTSLVVVATPIHAPGVTVPVVTRIKNITSTGFDLKLDRADGNNGTVSFNVSVVAAEEGVYTQAVHGVKMEVVKYTSTITAAGPNAWNAEARSYQNSYITPVVIGQVMSANSASWSVFWSMGASRQVAVDASNLNVGKHVGQDPNTTRADETIGYIVIESGSGTIDGIAYQAGLGPASVQSFGDSATPYSYTLSGGLSSVSTAAVSQSGMSGNDGAWAVLSGSPYVTTTSLNLHVSEDSLKDSRQRHSAERVAYVVFE